jgi:hypothetical protein
MYKYIIITHNIKLLIKLNNNNLNKKQSNTNVLHYLINDNNDNYDDNYDDNDNNSIYINYYNQLYKYYGIKQYEHHIELVLLYNNNYRYIKFYKYSSFYQTISRKYITYNLFPNDKRMTQKDKISILNLFLNLSKFN